MNNTNLQDTLYAIFSKEQIEKNAKLVLLPYYAEMNRQEWFEIWCRGHYYEKEYWVNLYYNITHCKLENKLSKNATLFDLFSLT